MDKYAVWVKAKPEFDRECIFVTGHLIKDVWDFNSWRIIKVDSEDGWYWALCNIDGEEWGPLEDLSAQLYYVLPNPDEFPVDRGVETAEEGPGTASFHEQDDKIYCSHCQQPIAGANDADYWKQKYEGMKQRCEAAEKVIFCIPDRKENLYELGFHQALKNWQTLKEKQL